MSDYKKLPVIETAEYQYKRAAILKEINANQVVIDRFVFKQTDRAKLKEAKKSKGSETLKSEFIKIIINNPMNCGDLKITIK